MRNRPAIAVILIITSWLLLAFPASGQNIRTDKVTLGLKDESLETALKKIEQQSVFRFFYRNSDIAPLSHLNLPPGARTIEQTLNALLQNTPLSFRQMDNNILLERRPQKACFDIKGRVINGSEKQPFDNASVFITNATVGGKTEADGTFVLHNLKPGEYDLIISVVGFETYSHHITIENNDIDLGDIEIFPRQIVLNEVTVNAMSDPDRERYFGWFKEEFFGTSKLASACKILNPEVLDFNYDEASGTLTASAQDFLNIENYALGYRIKYLLTDFVKDTRIKNQQDVFFEGYVWFEEMQGSAAQRARWEKKRREAYEGSMMHFLRSGLSDNLDEEGFLIYRVTNTPNPERPADSIIESRIKHFDRLKNVNRKFRDSLMYWAKKPSLPKYFHTLEHIPLKQEDFIKLTNHKGLYALFSSNNSSLYLDFNKKHHFAGNDKLEDVYSTSGSQHKTLIDFNAPYVLFDKNGTLLDPSCLTLTGAMTKERVADLLPVDYELSVAEPAPGDLETAPGGGAGIFSDQSPSLKAELLKLKARSDSLSELNTSEKPYLQLDKPYYAIGDTIWFKAYLVNAASLTPSDKSRIMYLDIANDSAKIVKRLSIPVSKGIARGNISLDEKEFSPGAFTIHAYTNWMRNWGGEYFFKKTFYIAGAGESSWLVNRRVIDTNGTANIKLQFSGANGVSTANAAVQLQVFAANKRLYKQTILTDKNGLTNFNLKLPEKESNLLIKAESLTGDKEAAVPILLHRYQNTDMQFLPEGGNLVAGLTAHIGFKAIGEDGQGVDVSGIISSNDHEQAAEFKSLHNGMGCFDLPAKEGENYTAKVTFPDGSIKEYQLPAVKSTGTVLQVGNQWGSDSLEVRVEATNDILTQGDSYFLIGKARGIICYAAVVNFRDHHVINRNIAKQLFPTGIAHFTLMTVKGRPLNERIVFIDHPGMNIRLAPDKLNYNGRDSVSLKIKVTDNEGAPVQGDFSLAVTDDTQVRTDPANNENILSRLLLTADLKGFVQDAGYYFSSKTPETVQALDNLLLTQGWVGYDWDRIFNPPVISYPAEHEFTVKGTVLNVFSKPVKGTNVLLFSKSPGILMDTTTDKNGKFVFNRFPRVDTPLFVLKAVNKNGNSYNVGIRADETPPPVFTISGTPKDPWYINSDPALISYTQKNALLQKNQSYKTTGHLLKEVEISGKKIIKDSQNLNGPGNADLVLDEKDLEAAGKKTWLQLLQENVKGFSEGSFTVAYIVNGGNTRKVVQDRFLSAYVTDFNSSSQWYFINGKPVKLIVDGISVTQVLKSGSHFQDASFYDMRTYLQSHTAEDIKGLEIMHTARYAAQYLSRYDPGDLLITALNYNPPVNISPSDIAFVEITTRGGHGPVIDNTPGMYLYKPLPLSWPKQFYKPKYTVNNTTNNNLNLRSTIDWEPNIITDAKGEATVSFFAAGKPSTYTVIIEGTDMNGNFGYRSAQISTGKAIEKSK